MFFRSLRGRSSSLLLPHFIFSRQLHYLITTPCSCQQKFYTFLRFLLSDIQFAVFKEQKNETNHLSITSVHFIFLSGERGIPSRRFSRPTPFPGEPLRPLGYFSKKIPTNVVYVIYTTQRSVYSGEDGIRTHVPVRTNGFQDRLVMTASIPLRIVLLPIEMFISREQMIY